VTEREIGKIEYLGLLSIVSSGHDSFQEKERKEKEKKRKEKNTKILSIGQVFTIMLKV